MLKEWDIGNIDNRINANQANYFVLILKSKISTTQIFIIQLISCSSKYDIENKTKLIMPKPNSWSKLIWSVRTSEQML